MAAGDWVSGAHIELDSGSSVVFQSNGDLDIQLRYWIVVPSGMRVFVPTPYPYTAQTNSPIEAEFMSAVTELVNQEEVPAQVILGADISTVYPG